MAGRCYTTVHWRDGYKKYNGQRFSDFNKALSFAKRQSKRYSHVGVITRCKAGAPLKTSAGTYQAQKTMMWACKRGKCKKS